MRVCWCHWSGAKGPRPSKVAGCSAGAVAGQRPAPAPAGAAVPVVGAWAEGRGGAHSIKKKKEKKKNSKKYHQWLMWGMRAGGPAADCGCRAGGRAGGQLATAGMLALCPSWPRTPGGQGFRKHVFARSEGGGVGAVFGTCQPCGWAPAEPARDPHASAGSSELLPAGRRRGRHPSPHSLPTEAVRVPRLVRLRAWPASASTTAVSSSGASAPRPEG